MGGLELINGYIAKGVWEKITSSEEYNMYKKVDSMELAGSLSQSGPNEVLIVLLSNTQKKMLSLMGDTDNITDVCISSDWIISV